ncbi:hypothetical protein [Laspinema olomoucense]|uniref:Uncharacterized protein n=1 Tax=Laspinema olomoucense D3b TaxID=2953688 RepID=A0ABT2N8Z9_9CYAN|nr:MULTISPECIES: hypothetical protein [unclassified Laspinema]MCT7972704.1 hypothetical protein [Laspinema sp. D3d]MCT7978210.1 hypothetical protein [Laspinema sp. D3b]MCT7988282.1 hypothetical protein [Laspinema sp. D3a]MCT7995827.1 hypothetical protein [Laspinema sp. D3c]
MLIAVIIINLILSLVFFFVAWRLWKLKHTINQATKSILNADRVTYNVLHATPATLAQGERGTRNLRTQYQQVELQLLRWRQILQLLSLGQAAWVRQSILKRRPRKQKLSRTL